MDVLTTVAECVSDLTAECEALDRVLATLGDEDWFRETPAVGWDTRDTVAHLADTNDIAFDSVTGGPRSLISEAQKAGGTVDDFTALQVAKGRELPSGEVYDWWKVSVDKLCDALLTWDPEERISWGQNLIAPRTFVTARIMEHWAHSLDVHDAAGVAYVDTDRLRHVAHLGLRAMPYAFQLAGIEAPGPIRVELTSPSGQRWALGPADAPTRIAGSASDWCRVIARRDRDGAASRLEASGPDAANAIAHARAYL